MGSGCKEPAGSEAGSRDAKMLPAALVVWTAVLLVHTLLAPQLAKGEGGAQTEPTLLPALAVLLLFLLIRSARPGLRCQCILLVCVALLAALGAAGEEVSVIGDPAYRQAVAGPVTVRVQAKATSPMTASERFGWDCRFRARLEDILSGAVRSPSRSAIRVYARGPACSVVQGGRYRLSGRLLRSTFGRDPLWLEVAAGGRGAGTGGGGGQGVEVLEGPSGPERAVEIMRQCFLIVARRLDDQGQVLVPGLTMGVLGQEGVVAGGKIDGFLPCLHGGAGPGGSRDGGQGGIHGLSEGVDPAYATRLKEDFKRSGILHLMAVSGGHFLLVGAMADRLLRALQVGKVWRGLAQACLCLGLASLMYPSDSVVRAALMGLVGALALARGRPNQSLNALSWTVLLVLLLAPGMATSYGFALSSSAVLGITLLADGWGRRMRGFLPICVIGPLSTSLAAQVATLPVQVLMNPQIPLFSLAANLLVTPFVNLSTMIGLAGLLTAWLWPDLGFVCAWGAGRGTKIMEVCARWLGGGPVSVLAWPSGLAGAGCVILCEAAIWIALIGATRLLRLEDRAGGDPFPTIAGGGEVASDGRTGSWRGSEECGRGYRMPPWAVFSGRVKEAWQSLGAAVFEPACHARGDGGELDGGP